MGAMKDLDLTVTREIRRFMKEPEEVTQGVPEEVAAIMAVDRPESIDTETPEDKAGNRQLCFVIGAAIGTLPAKEQELIHLHYWQSLTLKEIGKRFGVGGERIRQRIEHALSKLRRPLVSKKIGIACGLFDEESLRAQADREEANRKKAADEAEDRAKAWREERRQARAKAQQELQARKDRIKAEYQAEKPKTIPPKLHRLMGIIASLTPAEYAAIKAWRNVCKMKGCKSRATEYGYCGYHTEAVYHFNCPTVESEDGAFDALMRYILGE